MSSWGRSGVADVAEVSRDVAAVSPQCRGVSRRRREMSPRCPRGVAAVSPDVAGASPDVADVAESCQASSHFHRPKSPSNLIRRYGLNSLEVVWSVAAMSQRYRKVSPMSQGVADVAVVSQRCRDSVARCRGGVARCRSDVAMVSPDVAVVSRWRRGCRGAVTRCRLDDFFI